MTLDWAKPIEAYPLKSDAPPFAVSIAPKWHSAANHVPVRFQVNLWADTPTGGVWYFTDDGRSVGGRETGKDDSRFAIRNVIQSQSEGAKA